MPLPFASADRLLAHFQRTGDPRSLGRLFDRVAPELLRVAAWLCGNRTDAEDLLQRTFLTVLTTRDSYDAGRRALPWLCGILGNHGRKLHEQRARTEPPRLPAGERDPAAAAADGEFAAAVARVRAELGSPYAEVLDLHLGEGLDAKRIAERLGRPAGTVRTQIVRGLELLRRQLPTGFVAGLVLTASAHAASLAAVRAVVVARATTQAAAAASATSAITFGGMLMGKKLVWLAPSLLLLFGGGVWYSQQQNATPPVPAGPQPAVAQIATTTPSAAPAVDLAATKSLAREAAAPDEEIGAEPGFATLVVRMRWADDGSPAANVGVLVAQQPETPLGEHEQVTEALGHAVFTRLRPGSFRVAFGFAESQSLDLVAGDVRKLDVPATRKGFVHGLVVDEQRRPVADARVWLSLGTATYCGFEVARSDRFGRFELPYMASQYFYLGARKAGHAASRLRCLYTAALEANPDQEVVLTLAEPGGNVHGRVVDTDHRPLAGARVELGAAGGMFVQAATDTERFLTPTAPRLVANERGEFVYDGLAIGSIEVKAWAAGFGRTSESVVVEQDRRAEVVLVLQPGAIVAGVVRDQTGRPAPHAAIVSGGDASRRELGHPYTEADENGEYRLEGLPGGSVPLTVIARPGKASATVATTAGATTTWNPVVTKGKQLAGRVVGPDAQPVAGIDVGVVRGGGSMVNMVAITDAQGCFAIDGLGETRTRLMLLRDGAPCAVRANVEVTDRVLVQLTANEMPSATVHGRVVDDAGRPVGASISLMNRAFGMCGSEKTNAEGAFCRSSLAAGLYWPTIEAPGFARVALEPVRLSPGEDRALPDVVLAREGRVEIELRGVDASDRPYSIQIAREDGAAVAWISPDGNKASGELPPGAYFASAGSGDSMGSVAFRVRSGQTTNAVMTFVPGVCVEVAFHIDSIAVGEAINVIVRDSGNTPVQGVEFHMHHGAGATPSSWTARLPPGDYTVDALISDGRRAHTKLTVTTAPQPAVLEFPPR